MNLLLLGGESIRNKEWIHDVAAVLGADFDQTFIHEYKHWQTGTPNVDIAYELDALKKTINELGDDYVVFAKSLGAVLSVKGMDAGWLRPKKAFFCGVPLGYILPEYREFVDDLAVCGVPTFVLQNMEDPAGSYEDVYQYLAPEENIHIQINGVPGTTHSYDDLADIKIRSQAFFELTGK